MAKLATVLFSRKRKRETADKHHNKENRHPSTDETVITTDPCSDADDSPRSEQSMNNRLTKVQFSIVQIHEHTLVLGDNPAVSRGVPLTLAWERCSSNVYTIDEYEKRRQPKRRRNSLPLAYTPQQRETIAKLSGSSKKAIQFAGVRVKEIQQSREEAELDNIKRGMWDRLCQAPAIITRFRL